MTEPKTFNPEMWVNLYADQLFKFAVLRVNDSDLAKDLVQDTFLAALKGQQDFRGEVSEKNWLYTILKNKITDYYRKKVGYSFTELNEAIADVNDFFDEDNTWREAARPQEWSVDYTQVIEQKEFYKVLERCKQKMADLLNAVFTMKYLDDRDSDEICKELNISSSNYWVIMHRARLKIRQCLEILWFKR